MPRVPMASRLLQNFGGNYGKHNNELAALAKVRELTAEELIERDALRKEYIAEWRRGAEQVLENTYILTPDGKKTKLKKREK